LETLLFNNTSPSIVTTTLAAIADLLPDLQTLRRDLHAHPELGFAEHRTSAIVADTMRDLGLEVATGIGGTGVVATLRNGNGNGTRFHGGSSHSPHTLRQSLPDLVSNHPVSNAECGSSPQPTRSHRRSSAPYRARRLRPLSGSREPRNSA